MKNIRSIGYAISAKATKLVASALGALMLAKPVSCTPIWELDDSGAENLFSHIGDVYMRYAWIVGAVALIVWFIRPSGDKIGSVAGKLTIGIGIGYLVFMGGGAIMKATYEGLANDLIGE